jgi:hypothetical protein
MTNEVTRRQALARGGAAALGGGVALAEGGHPLFPPRHFRFTGKRMVVEAP